MLAMTVLAMMALLTTVLMALATLMVIAITFGVLMALVALSVNAISSGLMLLPLLVNATDFILVTPAPRVVAIAAVVVMAVVMGIGSNGSMAALMVMRPSLGRTAGDEMMIAGLGMVMLLDVVSGLSPFSPSSRRRPLPSPSQEFLQGHFEYGLFCPSVFNAESLDGVVQGNRQFDRNQPGYASFPCPTTAALGFLFAFCCHEGHVTSPCLRVKWTFLAFYAPADRNSS
jgi:hypothetical protein